VLYHLYDWRAGDPAPGKTGCRVPASTPDRGGGPPGSRGIRNYPRP